MSVLIDTAGLRARDRPVVLLDVRWALGDDRGRERYLAGHLPGAVFVDLETELADPPSAGRGRHPLPSLQRLQASARRWGIRQNDAVVVYDASGGLAAARAWWLLRWGGLSDVRLLDGGLDAWVRAGGPVEAGDVVPEPGDVTLTGGGMPVLTIDEAAALPAAGGILLDARAGARYRGEVEPVDPRAGHVPGAVSAPTAKNLAEDGTFRPAGDLGRRFADLGVEPGSTVGVYCGSGVTAAHEIAALAVAGIDAALWPGSWSQWSADPALPVATGPAPVSAGA
ncbi:sulfurtransferase [Blastococcus sp. CT_GayMR19]|uniref:sulfurtransferase n=1 Tax=Blastococcus sp. CT_GayMR19 TaxID=2559608 RepID=UPI0010742292|nr:sulfurtransferase [Blastococcus sp. CT_GayMR19]TFV73852.1 sulfurtransferase [Blastococcus sp. CT_GayMR19]